MNFFRFVATFLRFDHTNWRTILLCFLLAALFWILNALNKDYTSNLKFALKFKFDSSQYVPVAPLPNTVTMNVKGNGWNILRKSFKSYSDGVYITLKNPTKTQKILGTTLPMLLADQLKDLHINYAITDTLHLKIDPWKMRTVRATINAKQLTYQEGFDRLGAIRLKPDSIEVKGPKSTVEALPDSMIIEVSGNELDDNFREDIELPLSNQKFLKYTPENIVVSFDVVKWEPITKNIQLDIKNVPKKSELDLVKDSISCTFSVAQTKIDEFQKMEKQLVAYIDLRQLTEYNRKVVPKFIDLPEYARIIQIDSISIKSY